MIHLELLDRAGIAWAQDVVTKNHYLHRPVDSRVSLEGYRVMLAGFDQPAGLLLFGRPEATRVNNWYGSVDDVAAGRCPITRWQVLNLARVWFAPEFQAGGAYCNAHCVPGFVDRHGVFRSTLASTAIRLALQLVSFDYLIRRPPVFLNEPYVIRDVLSYCDSRIHTGTLYRESGFALERTNERGIQTWRVAVLDLTADQDLRVREASRTNARAIRYRGERERKQAEQMLWGNGSSYVQ